MHRNKRQPQQTAYIALGSNLGDRLRYLRQGIERLNALEASSVKQCSSAYLTAPVGDQAQPDFFNGVCRIETGLEPLPLLRHLLEIEAGFGRDRAGGKGGPRTLDLDLLLYGERVMRLPRLVIPHPRLHERAFVLYPLAEIAADLLIPGKGAVRELLPGCAAQHVRRLDEALT